MVTLDDCHIATAVHAAARSICRSKHGVALFDPTTGAHRGSGFNGPPADMGCPGRSVCAGTCGKRSVHAEVRALRDAETYRHNHGGVWDLVHVELAPDGGMVACEGPSCWQCSREILDVGFVGGVWLYEQPYMDIVDPDPKWHRYTAHDFHRATLTRCGIVW